MPKAKLKIDTYYDVQCDKCAFNRSSDYKHGMEISLSLIRALSKTEGWTIKEGKNICPSCNIKADKT